MAEISQEIRQAGSAYPKSGHVWADDLIFAVIDAMLVIEVGVVLGLSIGKDGSGKRKLGDMTGSGKRLARARLFTGGAIVLERLWPLILPFLIVVSLFLSLSWFGLFRIMPDMLRLVVLAGLGGIASSLLLLLRFFHAPTPEEIERRIERANGLSHNPVLVQSDRLSGNGGAFADILWREHQRRMVGQIGFLNSGFPHARLSERDPWGLRSLAALVLVTAFAFSFGPGGGRMGDAFRAFGVSNSLPTRIDAWVTPPAYTGKVSVLLTGDGADGAALFTVPAGSELTLRIAGGNGSETLDYTDANGDRREIEMMPVAGEASVKGIRQFAGTLEDDGMLRLRSNGSELRGWSFSVIADKPPIIRFSGDPKSAINGALELNYGIEDDYGPVSARAEFALAQPQPPGVHPLYEAPDMPLSLPRRGAREAVAKTSRNLTEHVWSGVLVVATLKVVDGAGQEGASETTTFVLPERPFSNPIARSVVELRRMLALDANAKPHVLQLMDAMMRQPEDTIGNTAHYMALISARTRLKMASSDDALRNVADYLWEIAINIEDGDLPAAEKRLRQAQEALKQALENGAADEEIDKLMQELREAMNEFLEEMARRARRDLSLPGLMGQQLRQKDIEKMLDQIENLARSGSRDKAQELLSQLQNMMDNLQAGRRQNDQESPQNSEMRQRMNELGRIMRDQQEMMNETFRMPQDGQGSMTPGEMADAMKRLQQEQGRLKNDLEALMKGLEELGIEPEEGFGQAGEAMGRAEGALGEGDSGRASGEQGRALEALRQGARDMMAQMRQVMQGEGGQGGLSDSGMDPLGRLRSTIGPDTGDTTEVPDEIDVQRARQILEFIRKRLGDALSPEMERRYLERLLEIR